MSKLPKSIKLKQKPFSLADEIDKKLKKDANWTFKNKDPRVKPSDLGHSCYRKIFYSYLKQDRDAPVQAFLKRIFDTGDAIHGMVEEWVTDLGYLIPYKDRKTGKVPIHWATKKPNTEFPVSIPELEIKIGYIDAILNIRGELYIGEWKSQKKEAFDEIKVSENPLPEHIMQANIYAHLFDFCRERGDYDHIPELKGLGPIKGIIFLYVNKDSTFLKEFQVLKTDEGLEDIIKKYKNLKEYVNKEELPPPNKEGKNCTFCDYKVKCEKNFNPLKN